jgi:flavorubredoxin
VEAYRKWAQSLSENKALIVYDTMWGSTERIAYALREGMERIGIPVTMRNLKTNDVSDIMTDVLSSRAVLVGSPTLNNGILPTVAAFLTYLEGLRPKKRIGFAFGSYGWGGQAVKKIETVLENLKWELPFEGINFQYVPEEDELAKTIKIGEEFGIFLKKEVKS